MGRSRGVDGVPYKSLSALRVASNKTPVEGDRCFRTAACCNRLARPADVGVAGAFVAHCGREVRESWATDERLGLGKGVNILNLVAS